MLPAVSLLRPARGSPATRSPRVANAAPAVDQNERGARSPLRSSLPPISAAAWVSFLLGAGPGSHGILDFRAVDARRYEGNTGHVVTSNDYPKRTVFDVAGSAGLRVASIRVPMTFPAWPVNGVLPIAPISGCV